MYFVFSPSVWPFILWEVDGCQQLFQRIFQFNLKGPTMETTYFPHLRDILMCGLFIIFYMIP